MTFKMKFLTLSIFLFAVPASLFAAPSDARLPRPGRQDSGENTPLIERSQRSVYRGRSGNASSRRLSTFDLKSDTSKLPAPAGEAALFTDLTRLRAGMAWGAILVGLGTGRDYRCAGGSASSPSSRSTS